VLEGWIARYGAFDALGLATFGPLDLDRTSKTYGRRRCGSHRERSLHGDALVLAERALDIPSESKSSR